MQRVSSAPPTQPRISARRSGFPVAACIGIAVAMFAGSACGGAGDEESEETTITAPAGDRDAPVPVGDISDIGGDWRLQVLDVIPDGSALIAANDPEFEPAPAGFTYLVVRLALGYFGTQDPRTGTGGDIDVYGVSNVALDDFCHVTVPDGGTLYNFLFSGGVVVTNACFIAPVAEAGTFQLYAVGDCCSGGGAYFELSPPGETVQQMASLTGPQPGARSTPGRRNPAPLGTPTAMGDVWHVTVTGAARDITEEVLAADASNKPPPSGFHYIGVELTIDYNGDFGASPGLFIPYGLVDSSNVSIEQFFGTVPGAIDTFTELVAGDSTSGMICLIVRDGASDILLYASLSDFEVPLTWFATS